MPVQDWSDTGIDGARGSILGVVLDASGPAANAVMRLSQLGSTNAEAVSITGRDGRFRFNNLAAGDYVLTAQLGGRAQERVVHVSGLDMDLRMDLSGGAGSAAAPVSVAQLAVPSKARNAFRDAQRAFARGERQKGEAKLAKALEIAPDFAEALALRAALAISRGDTESALRDADAAIAADANSATAYGVKATVLNTLRRYAEAQATLASAERLAPGAWQFHFEMSKALLGQRQAKAALDELDEAAELAPASFAEMRVVRGVALAELRRYDESAEELRAVVRERPDSPAAAAARHVLAEIERVTTAARQGGGDEQHESVSAAAGR